MKSSKQSVFCVLVTFNPNVLHLRSVINSILDNDVFLVVVDNNSDNVNEIISLISSLCFFKCLSQNRGIAYAQNTGIRYALEKDCDFIWLSDQDSIYPPDYANKMQSALYNVDNNFVKEVAGIGPTFFDVNRGALQHIVRFSPFTRKIVPGNGLNVVSHCIASGMFIPSSMFSKVGFKNDDLFIDWVDMEWCWRAIYLNGFVVLVNGDVRMEHSLGDSNVNFLGYKLIVRSPFRHYFMVRNACFLGVYASYLPVAVRFELVAKALIWMFIFPLIVPTKKIDHLKATFTGFYHGVLNHLGPR